MIKIKKIINRIRGRTFERLLNLSNPSLPLPKNVTEAELFNFVTSVRVADASEEEIKHMLYVELIQMPATEFNQFITDMVNDVPTAKKKMKELATDIRQKLKDENYRSAMGESFRISKLKNMINEEIRKILK